MMYDNDAIPNDDNTPGALAGWEGVAILVWVIVVELVLLQAIAVAAATGIYHLAPLLEVGQPQDFDDWLDIFQAVTPMLTLPGGAAIVLSTWLLTRRAQRVERQAAARIAAEKERADAAETNSAAANKRADAAETNSAAEKERADAAEAALAAAQAEVERLRAQNGQ